MYLEKYLWKMNYWNNVAISLKKKKKMDKNFIELGNVVINLNDCGRNCNNNCQIESFKPINLEAAQISSRSQCNTRQI